MICGFTGTRNGMTRAQRESLISVLKMLEPDEFHHGDCVGADAEAADVVFCHPLDPHAHRRTRLDTKIVAHPPTDGKLRANYAHSDLILPAAPYLDRNRNIVDACDVLVGCPMGLMWSGTWYTICYAKKMKKRTIVISSDGEVADSNA